MKKMILVTALLAVAVLTVTGASLAAERSLVYKSFKEGSGEPVNTYHVNVKDLPDGQKRFKIKIEGEDYVKNDETVLNENYETVSWKRIRANGEDEFTVILKNGGIFIDGKLKGDPVDKAMKKDRKPFYNTPKFNLTGFALSDDQKVRFWLIPKTRAVKLPMQAVKEGEETVEVNGKPVEAVKVYYSATGIREKFYNRYYYFRKSDGLFIKKVAPDGEVTELVDES